jgi:sensor histidine kinase YesM
MPVTTQEQIAKVSRMGIGLMVCISLLYVFYLAFAFRKINKYQMPIEENKKSITQFQKYLSELKK